MRALAIALCLLATPVLADVTGPARVIDGDTLEVQGERIRLHGIDAGMSPIGGIADLKSGRLDVCL
jgi:endonuclease YncB( thermonuclease family)